MSIHEEGTISVVAPMMPVFNNLVVFNPHQKQNRLDNIVPDLAESWTWSEDGKDLTFKLHQGVKWHDGKPFTAADVKCTWDLLQGKAKEKLRLNAREAWWANLDKVTADNDHQATFHLKRPQPAFLAFLASGFTPVYPCHVSPAQMRQHPIGTGPFKFVEYKPNQSIKVVKNPDYWKKGLPYLDGDRMDDHPEPLDADARLRRRQVRHDLPLRGHGTDDEGHQEPDARCGLRDHADQFCAEPADDAEAAFRQSRTAQGGGDDDRPPGLRRHSRRGARAISAPPCCRRLKANGRCRRKCARQLPGYAPDVAKSREEARKIMQSLGYGPDKHLALKISARNLPDYRDAASLLIDQLKQIWIDAELELVETANWLPKLIRSDFVLAQSVAGAGIDDPDQTFYENYSCKSNRNYTHYCDPEIEKMIDQQSMERDQEKRKKLVWEIDRKLQQAVVRPIEFYLRKATCWRPEVKGLNVMVNSSYNGWRMEDVWLDK